MPKLSEFISKISENPDPILRVVICLLLAIWAVATLFAWIFSPGSVEIPLILVGVFVIALGIVLHKGASTIMLATLIVGYIVVPESYLLKIAHMITDPQRPIQEYSTQYGQEGAPAIDTSSVTSAALKILASTDSAGDQGEIGNSITSALQKEFARLVKEESADVPLRDIVQGDSLRLFRDFGEFDYYKEDMEFLRSLGLITFAGRDFGNAQATEVGRTVSGLVDTGRSEQDLVGDVRSVDALFNDDKPDIQAMSEIREGTNGPFEFAANGRVVWYRLSVQNEETYRVDVVASALDDPLARLYDSNNMLIAEDDDSGERLNSRIEVELVSGQYFLGVLNLYRQESNFSIEIERLRG